MENLDEIPAIAQMEEKKAKAQAFSTLENKILVEKVRDSKDVLFGKFTPFLTKQMKEVWDNIALDINSQCNDGRTGFDVNKRWYNFQTTALKRVSQFWQEINKTGMSATYHLQLWKSAGIPFNYEAIISNITQISKYPVDLKHHHWLALIPVYYKNVSCYIQN